MITQNFLKTVRWILILLALALVSDAGSATCGRGEALLSPEGAWGGYVELAQDGGQLGQSAQSV